MGLGTGGLRIHHTVGDQHVRRGIIGGIGRAIQIHRPVEPLGFGVPQALGRSGVVPENGRTDGGGPAIVEVRHVLKALGRRHVLSRIQPRHIQSLGEGVILVLLLPDAAIRRAEAGIRDIVQHIVGAAAVSRPDLLQEGRFRRTGKLLVVTIGSHQEHSDGIEFRLHEGHRPLSQTQ